jgi:multidrug efflux pump subunit AcrA (membrane-fusion protein)
MSDSVDESRRNLQSMTTFPLVLLAVLKLAPASVCAHAQGAADLPGFVAGRVLPGVIVTGEEHRIDAPRDATIATVRVHEGQRVQRGERLVELTDSPSGDAMAVARAQRDVAEADVRAAATETTRLQGELGRRQRQPTLFPREQIESYAAQLHVAQARLDAARAELTARISNASSAMMAIQSLQIDAPADLRVQRVLAVAGSRVAAGTPLFDLVDDGTPAVRFAWPLQDAPASVVGKTVCVRPSAIRGAVPAQAQVIERSREPDAAAQVWIGQGEFSVAPDWAQAGVAVDVIVIGSE